MNVYLTTRTFAGYELCHDTILLAHRFFALSNRSAADIPLDGFAALKLLCCYPNTLPANTTMLRKAAAEVLPCGSYLGDEARKRELVDVVLGMLACANDDILLDILRRPEFDPVGDETGLHLCLTGAHLPIQRLPRAVSIYKPEWSTVHLSEGAFYDVRNLELVDAKVALTEDQTLDRATIQLSDSLLKGKKAARAEIYDSVVSTDGAYTSSIYHVNFYDCVVTGTGNFTNCSFKRCYIEGGSFTSCSAEECVLPKRYTVTDKKLVRVK